MTLSSPLEDLQRLTLQAIAGSLRKLEYLAGLKDKAGRYAHWGFARVYGEVAADATMLKAHRAALSQTLSRPLRELKEEVESCGKDANVPAAVYLAQLTARTKTLLPADPGAGSLRHLSSVLHALSELEKYRTAVAIRPV